MKKYILLPIVSLALAGCNPPQKVISDAANKCPQIGIDITHPDFYQKHKRMEVEEFYSCMQQELRPGKSFVFGGQGSAARNILTALNQDNETKASTQPVLEYQKNLWREVFNKERKPGAAYESWIQWVQNERNIDAANQASVNAAWAARRAEQKQEEINQQLQQIQFQQQWQQMQMNVR